MRQCSICGRWRSEGVQSGVEPNKNQDLFRVIFFLISVMFCCECCSWCDSVSVSSASCSSVEIMVTHPLFCWLNDKTWFSLILGHCATLSAVLVSSFRLLQRLKHSTHRCIQDAEAVNQKLKQCYQVEQKNKNVRIYTEFREQYYKLSVFSWLESMHESKRHRSDRWKNEFLFFFLAKISLQKSFIKE